MVAAVAYSLMVVGEATRIIPDEIRVQAPTVPWTQIVALRNVIVHEYARVNRAILWRSATVSLLELVPQLRKLLTDNPEE